MSEQAYQGNLARRMMGRVLGPSPRTDGDDAQITNRVVHEWAVEVANLESELARLRGVVEKQRVAVEAARRVIAITTINNAARLLIRDLHLAIAALDQPEEEQP